MPDNKPSMMDILQSSMEITMEDKFQAEANKALVGRKIVAVRWLSREETDEMGWHHRPICLQLDDGTLIWPSRDAEGNNAGVLFGQDPDGKEQTWPKL